MANQPQSKTQLAKKATPRKKAIAERWRLYRTLDASTQYTVPYTNSQTTTPYADAYRSLYQRLTDELLCLNSAEAKDGVKLRTQEKTIELSKTNAITTYKVTIKLFIYITR